jgi:hypothetical protein
VLYQTYKVIQEGGHRNAAILTDEQLLKAEPLVGLEWDRSVRWRDLHFVCSDEQRLNARSYAKIVAEGRAGLCTRGSIWKSSDAATPGFLPLAQETGQSTFA